MLNVASIKVTVLCHGVSEEVPRHNSGLDTLLPSEPLSCTYNPPGFKRLVRRQWQTSNPPSTIGSVLIPLYPFGTIPILKVLISCKY